jgi:hypothetical protein
VNLPLLCLILIVGCLLIMMGQHGRFEALFYYFRGYLYGMTSERKLVEELRMHLAWRWFTGLGSIRVSGIEAVRGVV